MYIIFSNFLSIYFNLTNNTFQVPFPAVTICPETKSIKKQFNYTRIFNEIKQRHRSGLDGSSLDLDYTVTPYDKETFEVLAQMCLPKGADVSDVSIIVNNDVLLN